MIRFLGLGPIGIPGTDLPQAQVLAILILGLLVLIFGSVNYFLEILKDSKNKTIKLIAKMGFLILTIGFFTASIGVLYWVSSRV